MSDLTPQRVVAAYDALMSGDYSRAVEYWDPQVRFLTPGSHQFSGWHVGLDNFMAFIGKVLEASGGSFQIDPITILINDEGYSIDVNKTFGRRAHAPATSTSPYDQLQIEGLHLLKWENGRVVEGRGAIFGDGMTNFNLWWSPVNPDGTRTTL